MSGQARSGHDKIKSFQVRSSTGQFRTGQDRSGMVR